MLPSDAIPPGWARAGFTGPDCVKLGGPRRPSAPPGGRENAGFTSPACERFVRDLPPSALAQAASS